MIKAEAQRAVFDFLQNPENWPEPAAHIEVKSTFGAMIFLSETHALKVKRAVKANYLDFTTLEARYKALRRELELNQKHAPDIYLELMAIGRDGKGRLSFSGDGERIEWALKMRRFAEKDILASPEMKRRFTDNFCAKLGDMVFRLHQEAPRHPEIGDKLPETIAAVMASIERQVAPHLAGLTARLGESLAAATARTAPLRLKRLSGGEVRRCHGDLHLGNIVTWQGQPVPFDALEFDEELGTIDILYDLAFLLMDLCRSGGAIAANRVFNRYLWRDGRGVSLDGLAILPLFISLRAAVRVMVALDRVSIGVEPDPQIERHIAATLALSSLAINPPPPRLVAIGGLSGTGKSTLGAALAPELRPIPGALHLRSDLERKWLAGAEPDERLPESAYTQGASLNVYLRLMERARAALKAGQCVIIDAVFAQAHEREAVAQLAQRLGVSFVGLWLEAPTEILRERVAARRNDASDADVHVVARQADYDLGDIAWTKIAASGDRAATGEAARAVIRKLGA